MLTNIKYAVYLVVALIGNPFYQMISFFICDYFGLVAKSGFFGKTDYWHVNLFGYLFFLILIFLLRYGIYSKKFTSKFFNWDIKGKNSFSYIFVERHVFQIFGVFTFWIWARPIEGIVFSLALMGSGVLGLIVSIITFIRLRKIKSIWIDADYAATNDSSEIS